MSRRLFILIERTDDPSVVRIRANSRSRLKSRPSTTLRRADLGPFLPHLLDYAAEPEPIGGRIANWVASLRRPWMRLPTLKTRSTRDE
jgi:hypothetical protein